MSMAIDPVCGMSVDDRTDLKEEFRGREYYFCSEECMHRFQSEPARYVQAA